MAPPKAVGSWTRAKVIALVVILLAIPLAVGVGVGWYGLNPTEAEQLSPVSSYAHELLDGFPDSKLVVEIAAPPGELPPASAITVLSDRMNETLQKSSIEFRLETYSQGSSGPLTEADLWSLETQVRESWPSWGTMSLFYLFVQGSYAGGAGVLGMAYRGSSIAVFPSVITAGGPPSSDPGIFATVLVHEFGHELGLVGLVGTAPNEDPNHPGHSIDPNDVMYWQVETTAILGVLGSNPPTQFDSADMSDLQTVKQTPIFQEVFPWVVLGVVAVSVASIAVWYKRRHRARPGVPGSA